MSITSAEEDNFLPISGIQHFAFCKRQWALIHIERLWEENVLTVEGRHLHERVDNPFEVEKRGDVIVARSVPLVSRQLRLYGVADVIEFHQVDACQNNNGTEIPDRPGWWLPRIVEYKRGKPKKDERDAVQLCAQAICFEEMKQVVIEYGYLFYGEPRRRQRVAFDRGLRDQVRNLSMTMQEMYSEGITPRAELGPNCKLCSIKDLCMPKLTKKIHTVKGYVDKVIHEISAGRG